MADGRQQRYRAGDLALVEAGRGLTLVHARGTRSAQLCRPAAVALVQSCNRFRTLDEHAAAAGGGPAILRELTRLVRHGFLVARDDVCRSGAGLDRPPPITSLTVVTRDRVGLLGRAVAGYADNCRRHGRDVEFVVGDDSPDPAVRARARTVLGEIAGQIGVRISYAGPEEKATFLDRVASVGGIPREVLRFGCLGAGASVTVGANRNAMLLQTAGEATLGVDDDTVCRPGRPPGPAAGAVLDPSGNPLALWFYPDRATALAAARPAVDDDLLGWHDRHLGHDCGALLNRIDADLDPADAATIRRLASRSGRVRLTTNGTAGDCGWDNPWFTLLQDGATHARLVASPEQYRTAGSGGTWCRPWPARRSPSPSRVSPRASPSTTPISCRRSPRSAARKK